MFWGRGRIFLCGTILVIAGLLITVQTDLQNVFSFCKEQEINEIPQIFRILQNVSGTSGKSFKGERVRSIAGPRWFSHVASGSERECGIPAVEIPKSNKECSYWGVVTTIFEPTQSVAKVAALPDFCIVVVADKKTPADYKVDGHQGSTVVLTVEMQEQMTNSSMAVMKNLLPWNHFGRKNLGYLFAVQQGAKFIWDFDDDNEPILLTEDPPRSLIQPVATADRFELPAATDQCQCLTANVYPAMGPSSLPAWPRGLPIPDIKSPCCQGARGGTVSGDNIGVFQALADHDPDVDAIYRLTQKLPLYFERRQKAMLIPKGILSPYNGQASLHSYNAMWGLLLPVTVHGRVSDIWRSYATQRLLWDIGLRLAFTPPWVEQHRNAHDYLRDFDAEQDLYEKSGALVAFLVAWQGKAPTLAGRLEELWIELYERGYVELHDVHLTQNWIKALCESGYSFPPLKKILLSGEQSSPQYQRSPGGARKRILITGVNGMIGSHTARYLVTKSNTPVEVYGLVRTRSKLTVLSDIVDSMTLVQGDITDSFRMRDIVAKIRPDVIYHYAAQAVNGISYDSPMLTLRANVIGTLNVLEAVRQAGLMKTRVLLAGSSTEYGRTADMWDGALPETAPFDPVTPYGVSKVATEQLGRMYFLVYGIPVVTARFFIQIGTGGTESLAFQNFAQQIAKIEAGMLDPVIQHGNLDTSRDTSDVRQSVPAVVKLADEGVPGEAYNVASGHGLSTKQLLDTMVKHSKVPVRTVMDKSRLRPYDEKTLLANISKLQAFTGVQQPTPDMGRVAEEVLLYWRSEVAKINTLRADTNVSSIANVSNTNNGGSKSHHLAPSEQENVPKRVLVTGVNGMIGSHTARYLVQHKDVAVYGLVRIRSDLTVLSDIIDHITLVQGDITDSFRMRDIVAKIRPDVIYHYAAQAVNGISYDSPMLTLDTNIVGTLNVLEAVRQAGLMKTRVLLAGSSTEYGRTADMWDGALPETAPFDPVTPYGVSKVATEQLGRMYFLVYGIPVVTARFFIQIGTGGTESLAFQTFARQIAKIEAGMLDPVIQHGNLDTSRDTSDVRQSVPAVVKLADEGVPGEAYNVASGHGLSTKQLLDTMVKHSKVPVRTMMDKSRLRPYDEKTLLANISKLQAFTGVQQPTPDMDRVAEDLLQYWRNSFTPAR